MALTSLLGLGVALSFVTASLGQSCYTPQGQNVDVNEYSAANASSITPCNQDFSIPSTCCFAGEICGPDNLCRDDSGGVYRQYCTDPTWETTKCSQLCPQYDAAGVELTPCPDGSYCCGFDNVDCCAAGQGVFINAQGQILLGENGPLSSIQGVTYATSTTSTSTSSTTSTTTTSSTTAFSTTTFATTATPSATPSSTPTSAPPTTPSSATPSVIPTTASTSTTNLGAIIGGAVGGVAVLLLAIILILLILRHRKKKDDDDSVYQKRTGNPYRADYSAMADAGAAPPYIQQHYLEAPDHGSRDRVELMSTQRFELDGSMSKGRR